MKKLIIVLSVLFCFSCGSGKVDSVDYEVIFGKNERNSGLDSIELITDKDDYNMVFIELNKTRRPGIEVPPIDFSKNTVLVIPYKVEQEEYNDIKINLSKKGETLHLETEEYHNEDRENNRYTKSPLYILKVEGVYKDLKIENED